MTLLNNWNGASSDYNDVWGYVDFSGKEYAIIGSKSKIHFFDITNPTTPILIAEFAPGSTSSWRDIKTFSHYAYAISDVTSQEGLVIFDLCDIENGNITKVYQKNEVFNKAHNLFADPKSKRLYVVGADTQINGMIVYDLSNPANPELISNITLPGGYVHDIFIKNDLAFCSHGYNGLYIYDFSDPTIPIPKAITSTNGYNHSSWALEKDSLLIFADEVPTGLPLGIIDYSGYANNNIEVVNTFRKPLLSDHTNNTPHNPYIVGNYAVVSHYEDGVVIFDLTDPFNPDTIAYYDTYVNSTYNGTIGCWGVYPFLPSGNILASDIKNGLFILKPSFDLSTTCNNGIKDWNEENIDCGGVCQLCTPCIQEICGNGLDDDRDGKIDCLDEFCDCPGSQTVINLTVLLEGFYDPITDSMTTELNKSGLLPQYQPFKTAPFYYSGREHITSNQTNIVDWVLVEARDANQIDSVISRKAALLLNDGRIMQADGSQGIQFGDISAVEIHVVVRHKGHLAIISRDVLDLTGNTATYDFTTGVSKTLGTDQLKLLGNRYCQFAGDFDQNGIINSTDFNFWKQNSNAVDRYLFWDADGNTIINVEDFNLWKGNRSKIGEPMIFLQYLKN